MEINEKKQNGKKLIEDAQKIQVAFLCSVITRSKALLFSKRGNESKLILLIVFVDNVKIVKCKM